MRGKFMVKIMPKVCTTNINKESELRQQIKNVTDLIVLKKTKQCLDWRGKIKPLLYLIRSIPLKNWCKVFTKLFKWIYLCILLLWKWSQVANVKIRAHRPKKIFKSSLVSRGQFLTQVKLEFFIDFLWNIERW